jgi:hypothetical protein
MKRKTGLALVVFLLFSGICFAQGFEVGGSIFIVSADGVSGFGGGLNIAGTQYFTDTIGYGVYGNIMYGSYKGVSLIPIDLLVGPVFKVINNERFTLPIAVGLYAVNYFAFGDGGAIKMFNIGIGGNISAEIKFTGNMYLYLRLQGAYAFLGEGVLMITPSIGIGFGRGGGGVVTGGGSRRRR